MQDIYETRNKAYNEKDLEYYMMCDNLKLHNLYLFF